MEKCFNCIFLILIIIFTYGCKTDKVLLGSTKLNQGIIKYYGVSVKSKKDSISKLIAQVNYKSTKRFYSFYPDKTLMTESEHKELIYEVTYNPLIDNFDTMVYNKLTNLDSTVFINAEKILNRYNYTTWKPLENVTGFRITVNYYHGFPKHKKFNPL